MSTSDSTNVSTARATTERRPTASTAVPTAPDIEILPEAPRSGEQIAARYVLAATRLSLGFIFFWAFLDKLFGLGKSTPSERSWLNGGSPTTGYLNSVDGPLAGFYNGMANNAFIDWLFMIGLAGIGGALLLGIGMRIAGATGALMMLLMWGSALPISSNPFIDDHIVYALVLVALALMRMGNTLGLGKMWNRLPIVNRFPILR
jgi:thiosulfate dehydrogenase (quinone) large subunit